MYRNRLIISFLMLLFLLSAAMRLCAQECRMPVTETHPVYTDSSYHVGQIIVSGNKKTKEEIILRELGFQTGEPVSLAKLASLFQDARAQLMNTGLFQQVMVAAMSYSQHTVTVLVDVKERWYIFPAPYFKPVDRNLNQWLFQNNGSLDRVNYGAKLIHNNLTGNMDRFRFYLIYGYTHQFGINYDRPYFDRQMHWGLKAGFSSGKNREINYNTVANRQVFLKDPVRYVRSFINSNVELIYRPAIRTRHRFGIGYSEEAVQDTVVALNPSYLKSGRNRSRYLELYYRMNYTNLDYIPYPTKGYAAEIFLGKKGFNNIINVWQLYLKGSANWHLAPCYFLQLNALGGLKLPFKQPYYNQRFLGYGDSYMQGYEYYVVDGVAGGYLKAAVTHELFNCKVKVHGKRDAKMDAIPFRVYGKVYGNAGYIYNPQPGQNDFSNKLLYSGGLGLDIVTIYDVTLKLEWTFNHLGQNGVFLHQRSMF